MQNKLNTFQLEIISIIILTLIGAYLRFYNLGTRPLFCDEAYVGLWTRGQMTYQEIFPVFILKLFNPTSDYGLRFLYALCGTLTIPAIWYILKDGKLFAALLVTIFPIFVFWSKLARPYAIAGLFIVLGWKWWQFYILALLTTPISLIGIKLFKQKKYVFVGAILIAGISYFLRPDVGKKQVNFLDFFWQSSRFFYLPAIVFLLYFFDYIYKYINLTFMLIIIVIVSIFFIVDDIDIYNEVDKIDNQWYRKEIYFSDWRKVGCVDYATQPNLAEYYSYKLTKIIGESDILDWKKDNNKLNEELREGNIITLGIDRRGNWTKCKEYLIKIIPDLFVDENYRKFIILTYYNKMVLRLKVWKDGETNKWLAF